MTPFQPLPLLGNPHVQTILGNLLTGHARTLPTVRRVVSLPDGDAIALHESSPRTVHARSPISLLLHGLGGNHRSPYMTRLTHRLRDRGWRVFRMDLRAAGAGVRLARRFYNAGCSADVRAVVAAITGAYPLAPVAIVGFSLGGNIALKYAGESPGAPVAAVAALAPPIDLVRCSHRIARLPLYDSFYVRHLTTQVGTHQACFPDLPRVSFPRRTTLRHFDDLYTAPRWGYADAMDYYAQASSFPLIPAIRVPTFILTARDDPFVAVQPFEELPALPAIELHISEHGGHMGFLGRDGNGGIRWAETQAVNWLTKQIK